MTSADIPYQVFQNFVLRTPLLPLSVLESVYNSNNFGEEIRKYFSFPEVQEAIYLASPDLHQELMKWLENDDACDNRLLVTLLKYLTRMASRCTPFGLFAGMTLGKFGNKTDIRLYNREKYKRHTRLDMNYLCSLAADLSRDAQLRGTLKFYPNSSPYQVGKKIRYVEYHYENARRIHKLVAVENSSSLVTILKSCRQGATIDQMISLLQREGIKRDEALQFINELINCQLLVSELEPTITGPEFLAQILHITKRTKKIPEILAILDKVKTGLEEMDHKKFGTVNHGLEKICKLLGKLKTPYDNKYLLQVDLVKPAHECILESGIADKILEGVAFINRLSPDTADTRLERFRKSFYERYKEREVPLFRAIDAESGIPYTDNNFGDISPLIDDLILPYRQETKENAKTFHESFLEKKHREAVNNDLHEIEISDDDIEDFPLKWDDLPDTFNILLKIAGSNHAKELSLYLEAAGGSSASKLLGRFCHADEATCRHVKDITEKENELNPGAILAEIVHLPESRTGNILMRPVFRDYEIPYLARSSVGEQFQIPAEDLLVSVKNGRICLRSAKLNRQILPRLSAAHNYEYNALPLYQFLCDLQGQGKRTALSFNWGPLAATEKFLPRVTYKGMIISAAMWNIDSAELLMLIKIKDDNELKKGIDLMRKKTRLPAKVIFAENDHELYLNLDHVKGIHTLFSLVKGKSSIRLSEFLFDPFSSPVQSVEGGFTNEFIISCFRKHTHVQSTK